MNRKIRGPVPRFINRHRHAFVVFGVAFGLHLVFAALMADSYDPDEFVYLALSRDVAHGAVPYHDFMFFHPPGLLVLLRLLDPLTAIWWPCARVAEMLADSATAVLVWRIGLLLYGRREALAAGFLYAMSPIVLISAGRVEQEPLMTMFGMAGLTVLLTRRSHKAAAIAGGCLGAACWVKYPALIFLPVYALAAPRRIGSCLLGCCAVSGLLFAPYLREIHALYDQTVSWQIARREGADPTWRHRKVEVLWLLMNPLAVAGLGLVRKPFWLVAGFMSGGAFLFAAYAYYHYFLPVAPFAALLGAPVAVRFLRISPRVLAVLGLALTVAWATDIRLRGPGRSYVASVSLSGIQPTIALIRQATPPGAPVLGDRFEYAYLAGRPWVANYFWNMHELVDAHFLEQRLGSTGAVVFSHSAHAYSFPMGFQAYLDAHYYREERPGTTIWLIDRAPNALTTRRDPGLLIRAGQR